MNIHLQSLIIVLSMMILGITTVELMAFVFTGQWLKW